LVTLQRALKYRLDGDYARARAEFETVLQLENLPPDLHQIVNVYARAAEAYLAGRRLIPAAYVVASAGNYREKATIAGAGVADDMFGGMRVGGRLVYVASDRLNLDAAVDYQFRTYDDRARRNDSDLLWTLAANNAFAAGNLAIGVRGWASYRGDGITRHDYGVFSTWRRVVGPDDRIEIGAELRRRHYPAGLLRDRSRDIIEGRVAWTHGFAGGRASFTLAGHGGREFARFERPDGDSNFVGLSPSINAALGERWGVFAFGWWQNGRYNVERYGSDSGDELVAIGRRNDDLYEAGGGVTYMFADGWEVGANVLHIRDASNVVAENYRSTELFLTVRRDF
jgi:hypothetical protein